MKTPCGKEFYLYYKSVFCIQYWHRQFGNLIMRTSIEYLFTVLNDNISKDNKEYSRIAKDLVYDNFWICAHFCATFLLYHVLLFLIYSYQLHNIKPIYQFMFILYSKCYFCSHFQRFRKLYITRIEQLISWAGLAQPVGYMSCHMV